jgi:hypothetical protein
MNTTAPSPGPSPVPSPSTIVPSPGPSPSNIGPSPGPSHVPSPSTIVQSPGPSPVPSPGSTIVPSPSTIVQSPVPSPSTIVQSPGPSPVSSGQVSTPSAIYITPSSISSPSPLVYVEDTMQQFTIILLLITGMCFFLGFRNRKMLKKVGRKSYSILTENDQFLEMNTFDIENHNHEQVDQRKENKNNYTD